MVENKIIQLNFENSSYIYNVSNIIFMYSESLVHILISDLVIADFSMHLIPDMILFYLATPFYTKDVLH